MSVNYPYTISTEFSNGVLPNKLKEEVEEGISSATCELIETSNDTCNIWFNVAISSGDETVLDGIVAAHDPDDYLGQCPKCCEESEGNTQSESYSTITSLSGANQPPGIYMICWYVEFKVTGGNGDSVDVAFLKDTTETGYCNSPASQYRSFSGFCWAELGPSISPTFYLKYKRNGSGGDTVYYRRARMLISQV